MHLWWSVTSAFVIVLWSTATLVFATAPRRAANRLLAVILVLEGVALASGVLFAARTPLDVFYAAAVLADVAWVALPPLYLAFVGAAIDSPLTRPLRLPVVRRTLVAASVALAALAVAFPDLFVARIRGTDPYGFGTWIYKQGWGEVLATVGVLAASAFALAASIVAFRAAPKGSPARTRARAFLLAFGCRDFVFVTLSSYAWYAQGFGPNDVGAGAPSDAVVAIASLAIFYVFMLGYCGLLVYGILKGQLLDLDVKLKWTIRRGTVAAVFLAMFFVVAQVAQTWLSDAYGYIVGGIAAAALLFAIAPVQRAAERVADKALPNARASQDLSHDERLALFREMVTSAWADGVLTREERRMLGELRAKLGIPTDEAERVEREVAAGVAPS